MKQFAFSTLRGRCSYTKAMRYLRQMNLYPIAETRFSAPISLHSGHTNYGWAPPEKGILCTATGYGEALWLTCVDRCQRSTESDSESFLVFFCTIEICVPCMSLMKSRWTGLHSTSWPQISQPRVMGAVSRLRTEKICLIWSLPSLGQSLTYSTILSGRLLASLADTIIASLSTCS